MLVKICGITQLRDAEVAAECGADFIGLIRARSPRQVPLGTARDIAATVRTNVATVLLYQNASMTEIVAEVRQVGTNWVQLHGKEPPETLGRLAEEIDDLHVIRAWAVRTVTDLDALLDYQTEVVRQGGRIDVLLLDAPKGEDHPGYVTLGHVARGLDDRPPAVWCAGGLTSANVAEAVAHGRYDGVDVARGVELKPGVKDAAAIRAFVDAARRLPA